jgi:glutathione peroxidase
MRQVIGSLAALLAVVFVVSPAKVGQGVEKVAPALSFQMKSLDGKQVDLSKYQGKVVLMVNVASKCGLTPQYAGLEKLHEKYADKGLAILGFPANEFLSQEPGTDAEISEFCTSKYGVKFDMFSKVVVKGDGQCPLYKFLTSEETDPKFAGDIKWNFEKFLLDRQGNVINRFAPKVTPESPEVVQAIEAALSN